eukprot:163608-Prymnesium_polylepis.1
MPRQSLFVLRQPERRAVRRARPAVLHSLAASFEERDALDGGRRPRRRPRPRTRRHARCRLRRLLRLPLPR